MKTMNATFFTSMEIIGAEVKRLISITQTSTRRSRKRTTGSGKRYVLLASTGRVPLPDVGAY